MLKAMLKVMAVCLAAVGSEQVAAQNVSERPVNRPLSSPGLGIFDPQPAKPNCTELPASLIPLLPKRVVCKVEVVVSDQARCLPSIDPGALIVRHADNSAVDRANFRVRWMLKSRSGNLDNLSFAPDIGIDLIQGPDSTIWAYKPVERSDDDGESDASTSLPIHWLRASANQTSTAKKPPHAFHYNVTVLRKDANGVWIQCGAIDPLIVNTD